MIAIFVQAFTGLVLKHSEGPDFAYAWIMAGYEIQVALGLSSDTFECPLA